MKTAIHVCALILVAVAAVAGETALKSLYGPHRWFELRDALQGQNASPLKGAVASGFNHTKAASLSLRCHSIELLPQSRFASNV